MFQQTMLSPSRYGVQYCSRSWMSYLQYRLSNHPFDIPYTLWTEKQRISLI